MRPDKMAPATRRRILEQVAIYAGAAIGALILLTGLASRGLQPSPAVESPAVQAIASAMPGQGWAPLRVYFSAFGSGADGAEVIRYEWDLDGDGQLDFDATAQGGYANYLYSKPGAYTITLQVTDALGRFATARTTLQVRHPAGSSVDYWTVFDDRQVRRIDIRLPQAEWDQMWIDPMAKYTARASAIVFGQELPDAGFRMRGQFSLQNSNEKKPWEIDTDAFIAGQEYANLHQLVLLNSIGDPSLLREKLAYEMMHFAGLPASHVAFVELWIDISDDSSPAEFWGVYALVERVDQKFLRSRFGGDSRGGNLYKASHAQRGPMDLIYYGEEIQDYPTVNGQVAYGKMNNELEADYSDIIRLCRVVDGAEYASEGELIQALESVLNVDAFLRYLAVITILDNWDSYPYTGNNYYLFNNPVSGRFEWIPWDLTWGGNAQASLFPSGRSELMPRAPLVERVFSSERYRRQYLAYVELLLRYWFNPDQVKNRVQQYQRLIAPYVTQATGDKAFYGEQPMFSPESFTTGWVELVQFTDNRYQFLIDELKKEMIRPGGIP